VLCIGIIVSGVLTKDQLTQFRNLVVGIIAMISAVVGCYGAFKYERSCLLFFFITQVWGLASVTNYLYSGVKEDQAQQLYCNQLNIVDKLNTGNPDLADDECSTMEGLVVAKIVMAVVAVVISWFSAYFALRLSEKIQDAEADVARAQSTSTLKVLPVSSDGMH